jgi:hypothetical protein
MISSKPACVRGLRAKLLNGLIVPCGGAETPSGEKVGVRGGSPTPVGDVLSDGVGLIRMGSMLTGIKVSRAALG